MIINLASVQSIDLPSPQQKVFDGKNFPLVLSPTPGFADKPAAEWSDWVTKNRDSLRSISLQYGAIVFRGFNLDTPKDFDNFVKAFSLEPYPYIGGAAVREVIVGNVMTTNEAPPPVEIGYHHEFGVMEPEDAPKYLIFYCDVPPAGKGQTPLAKSDVAYQSMKKSDPDFVAKLETEGIRYRRIMPPINDPSSTLGQSWQLTYNEDPQKAIEVATRQGFTARFLENNCLESTSKPRRAVVYDATTQRKVWFNLMGVFATWKDNRNDGTKSIVYPSGELVPEKCLQNMQEVIDKIAVEVSWQKGDVIMVDNLRVLHARRSFSPPRRILVSMCKGNYIEE